MKMGKFLAALAGLALTFGVAGQALAADAGPIKIGVYLPLTGQNAFGGQLELEGVRLAHKEMPKVLDRPVELVVVDNKSDKVESANAVKRLIERDKVVSLIGTYGSSLAMAGAEVAEKAAVLMDMTSDYAVGLSSFFTRDFKKLGGEIVSTLKYSTGDQDFTAQLTELIAKKPDVVFMPAYFAEGAIIMKQARELGAKFRLMGADAMDNPDTLKLGGKAAEGFLHTTFPYDPAMPNMSPAAKRFTEAWKAAYPDKETNVNGALGYNTYFLILDAIKRANSSDPKAIAKALAETKDLPTALGLLTINATHDAEMPVGIIEYKDGKRVYVGEVTPK